MTSIADTAGRTPWPATRLRRADAGLDSRRCPGVCCHLAAQPWDQRQDVRIAA